MCVHRTLFDDVLMLLVASAIWSYLYDGELAGFKLISQISIDQPNKLDQLSWFELRLMSGLIERTC